MAMTHGNQYGEEYYSFVEWSVYDTGWYPLSCIQEAIVRAVREHFLVRTMLRKISGPRLSELLRSGFRNRYSDPQTKTKLGSNTITPDPNSTTVRTLLMISLRKGSTIICT